MALTKLNLAKMTTGSLGVDTIPDLPTSKITSGTFADARLSSSSITQHVDLTSLSADNLTSGTIPNARYGTPTFNGSNLTSLPASAPVVKYSGGTFSTSGPSGGGKSRSVSYNLSGFSTGGTAFFRGNFMGRYLHSLSCSVSGSGVSNVQFHSNVPSGSNRLPGQDQVFVQDFSGSFDFTGAPSGSITINTSYDGNINQGQTSYFHSGGIGVFAVGT